jgi:hypothetical protein
LDERNHSIFSEFDIRDAKHLPITMEKKQRKTVYLPKVVIDAAAARGMSLGDYVAYLHAVQRSIRVTHVISIYRGFALLEMARVPMDPAYYDLVYGVLGEEDGKRFQKEAGSGEPYALPRAAARLLGADTRISAVEAIFMASIRANVMHEGFIEAARLLEASLMR